MSSNKPPINIVYVDEVFVNTIKQLSKQIDWTTDYMNGSESTTTQTDCNEADHNLVKNILEIAYIPIIYHFKIQYKETNNTSQPEPNIDNIHVDPYISIDTKYTINTTQNPNRIIKKFDIAERENAYKYMFELAFGQLNTPLAEEDLQNQKYVNIEGYDNNTYETFNSPKSKWKIDFQTNTIMLDISFITITTIKDGKMEVSILDNMIKGEKVEVSDPKKNVSRPSTPRVPSTPRRLSTPRVPSTPRESSRRDDNKSQTIGVNTPSKRINEPYATLKLKAPPNKNGARLSPLDLKNLV